LTPSASTIELLRWIDDRPRSYDEAIEAWRTSCPRLSVWDDAVSDGLVQVVRDPSGAKVVLTARGSDALQAPAAR
jgi:hypothetical protein